MNEQRSHTISTPRVGDIWKEVDPRSERYVRVESVGTGRRSIAIRTVRQHEGNWYATSWSRLSYADVERFNGKRSGYALHHRSDEEMSRG